MALRYPGLPPQVKSGLLGTYNPPGVGAKGAAQIATGGTGSGLDVDPWQAPDLQELSTKYLADYPSPDITTDPIELYEGTIGGVRQDVYEAMGEAGGRAISQAAASGREVADVMARYLPEAIKGLGKAAGQVGAAATEMGQRGEIAKSELEIQRKAYADEMARFDYAQQQDAYQFMTNLETEYDIAMKTMQNNYRIAQLNAQTQKEMQQIDMAYKNQQQQIQNEFEMRTTEFVEGAKDKRYAAELALRDKYAAIEAEQKAGQLSLDAGEFVSGLPPTYEYVDPTAPQPEEATVGISGDAGIAGTSVGFGGGYDAGINAEGWYYDETTGTFKLK